MTNNPSWHLTQRLKRRYTAGAKLVYCAHPEVRLGDGQLVHGYKDWQSSCQRCVRSLAASAPEIRTALALVQSHEGGVTKRPQAREPNPALDTIGKTQTFDHPRTHSPQIVANHIPRSTSDFQNNLTTEDLCSTVTPYPPRPAQAQQHPP